MLYYIYTDGACNHIGNKIASSFLIKTKAKFIAMGSRRFNGNNIAIAESIAVGIAIEELLKEIKLEPTDRVIIKTDCMSVIDFFKDVRVEGETPKTNDAKIQLVWDKLKELDKLCTWDIEKIKAHKSTLNGNKVADRLAKYALRCGSK